MPTYIALLRWTQEGIENVKEGPSRLDQAKGALKAVGGELKAFYLTMGSYDMSVKLQTTPQSPNSCCQWPRTGM